MLATAISASEKAAEHHNSLPIEPYMYGVITMIIFLVLLIVTWSFKNIGRSH